MGTGTPPFLIFVVVATRFINSAIDFIRRVNFDITSVNDKVADIVLILVLCFVFESVNVMVSEIVFGLLLSFNNESLKEIESAIVWSKNLILTIESDNTNVFAIVLIRDTILEVDDENVRESDIKPIFPFDFIIESVKDIESARS